MAIQPMERELIRLEKKYWQAIKDRNVDAAMNLTDEPCIVTGSRGAMSVDKHTLKAMMKDAPYTLHDFQLRDPQVRLLGDDVAIVAYQVHEELTVDGRRMELDAADSSTWVRRDGRWVCALHTEAIAGDPFGRDRLQAASV